MSADVERSILKQRARANLKRKKERMNRDLIETEAFDETTEMGGGHIVVLYFSDLDCDMR